MNSQLANMLAEIRRINAIRSSHTDVEMIEGYNVS